MKTKLLFSIVAIVLTSLIILYFTKLTPTASADKPNIIIISVDTLRADHLGVYGYTRNTSPNIDEFAKSSTVFDKAFTPIPCTVPSYASLFTGQYPLKHQVFESKIKKETTTLAEKLSKEGYLTAGFVSSKILSDSFNNMAKGFMTYNEPDETDEKEAKDGTQRLNLEENSPDVPNIVQRASRTSAEASNWLEKNSSKKFFLFVHYFDPHLPYGSPGQFDGEFSSSLPKNTLENIDEQTLAMYSDTLSADDLAYLQSKYDEDIKYTDFYIGELLKKIQGLGLNKNSVIILTADHGESFGNNYLNHCYRIYDSTVQIPLIISDPKMNKSTKIAENVSLLDIYPTIMGRLGLSMSNLDGIDLGPIIEKTKSIPRTLFTMSLPLPSYATTKIARKIHYQGQLYGAIKDNERLIYNQNSGKKNSYDITEDPKQNTDIFDNRYSELFEKTILWISKYKSGTNKSLQKNDEMYNTLKGLGYL